MDLVEQLYNPSRPLERLLNHDLKNLVPRQDSDRAPVRTDRVPPKQTQHRLGRAEIDDLVGAYQAGETVAAVAKRYRVHRTTALAILQRTGVPRRRQALTPEQVHQAVSAYKSGLSLVKVAEPLGGRR